MDAVSGTCDARFAPVRDALGAQLATGNELGVPLRFGIGRALPGSETLPYVPEERLCYWGGWGGSLIVSDLHRGATISYMMNRMAPGIIGSDRSEAYVRAVYRGLDR